MSMMIHTMKYWRLCFQGNNYIIMDLFLKGQLKGGDDDSECNEKYFPYDITFSAQQLIF